MTGHVQVTGSHEKMTHLHGVGMGLLIEGLLQLQAWSYFAKRQTDVASVKWTVLLVVALETIQVVFFFRSSYFRFVERFGQIQLDLIWDDSLQLLAAYLSAFIVQLYFVSRIHKLTKGRTKFSSNRVVGMSNVPSIELTGEF
ncbi:hypothetical protein B0H12DRAFT_1231068 [Mycena haematopus]|nr:hypothetical protein B0H12DRAFT_1231068 [Mycena haematopus]